MFGWFIGTHGYFIQLEWCFFMTRSFCSSFLVQTLSWFILPQNVLSWTIYSNCNRLFIQIGDVFIGMRYVSLGDQIWTEFRKSLFPYVSKFSLFHSYSCLFLLCIANSWHACIVTCKWRRDLGLHIVDTLLKFLDDS